MDLLPDTSNCGLRMRRECRERFLRRRLQRKPAVLRPRHASRHLRHALAAMHVGITNPRWQGKPMEIYHIHFIPHLPTTADSGLLKSCI